ncbi:AsnC family transcriptional regulator [Aeromicrobium flavum]|uniref:AsnC family transcriptional regulator n=1 Tax=Aeromicrobium flavum TaxID=416568 RepID=A0A512HXN0_9ACTN|nr:Lrp/AsnC family transcriptional regulator [Aeromicrobium flavum]GEO90184.1 AsnC family transcriptional regulator [Aeromicrobium flavum]
MADRVALDDISKHLVSLLQKDGRMSYAAMAAEVGLSEAAVRHRVAKLLDGGVVQVVAVTDPLQLGFPRQAMIGVTVSSDVRKVAAEIAEVAEVDYVVITAGRFDILAEIVAESDDNLLDIVASRIIDLPGVASTETFMYLKLEKQTYAWGVR